MTQHFEWADERALEALHLMDHKGWTATRVAKHFGLKDRNPVLGIRFRTLGRSYVEWPDTTGDGTMASDWWQR